MAVVATSKRPLTIAWPQHKMVDVGLGDRSGAPPGWGRAEHGLCRGAPGGAYATDLVAPLCDRRPYHVSSPPGEGAAGGLRKVSGDLSNEYGSPFTGLNLRFTMGMS